MNVDLQHLFDSLLPAALGAFAAYVAIRADLARKTEQIRTLERRADKSDEDHEKLRSRFDRALETELLAAKAIVRGP